VPSNAFTCSSSTLATRFSFLIIERFHIVITFFRTRLIREHRLDHSLSFGSDVAEGDKVTCGA